MADRIIEALCRHWGLTHPSLSPMTTGVGGDTYRVQADEGAFVYKLIDSSDINHPELEPALCDHLRRHDIPASQFVRNREGGWITPVDGRLSHLQVFVPGRTFAMNGAPDWFMAESPRLLARIHRALETFPALPTGIGTDFFRFMTPEWAEQSYRQSCRTAQARGETEILDDLNFRLTVLDSVCDWRFDLSGLTCRNTHGDYTVNQILCGDRRVHAVIDWTSACVHPVVWEIARSFFYADPSCRDGACDMARLTAYVNRYAEIAPLNEADRENLLRLYFYQLAVCDYYAQYLSAAGSKRAEFLLQARFATNVLRHMALIPPFPHSSC